MSNILYPGRRRLISSVALLLLILIAVGLGVYFASSHLRADKTVAKPLSPTIRQSTPSASANVSGNVQYAANVVFIGDIMLARSIGEQIIGGADPFEHVHQVLNSYDLRVANIETTIASPSFSVPAPGKLYTFNAPLQSIPLIKRAGVDVSDLANNHTSDFGSQATTDMLNRFRDAGLQMVGAGQNPSEAFRPLIMPLTLRGGPNDPKLEIKLAFIAFNDIENEYTAVSAARSGSAYYNQALLLQSIRAAKAQGADFVIALPHWGIEYQPDPSPRQKQIGHWLIDNGVDLVVGNHPHVVEPTELYKEKYIVYSLGNFIFDQMQDSSIGQLAVIRFAGQATTLNGTIQTSSWKMLPIESVKTEIDSRGFATIP